MDVDIEFYQILIDSVLMAWPNMLSILGTNICMLHKVTGKI